MIDVPEERALAALLDRHARFEPVPLCPEVKAWHAHGLVDIWSAAERLAGETLDPPFWAYPWAAGQALARVILDEPGRVHGRTVLDFGAGGGVASLACARAGAARVVANDIDPWALIVARLAASRQDLRVETLCADLTGQDAAKVLDGFDVVLCSDLAYDRRAAPRERAFLDSLRERGTTLLVADAGRTYFDADGLELIATCTVSVPVDLEGGEVRTANVYSG